MPAGRRDPIKGRTSFDCPVSHLLDDPPVHPNIMLKSNVRSGAHGRTKKMANSFPDWLFNVMLLGGIVALLLLTYHVFFAPILGAMTVLIALIVVAVIALFWPRY